jgi:hypothetical protein
MEKHNIEYLEARHGQEMAAATAASNNAARVAHFELAYRYSLAIAHASGASDVPGESVDAENPRTLIAA